jgi:GT2 family glycosyltransferase
MSFRLGVIDGLRFDEDGLRGYALGEDLEFCVQAARRGELWIAAGTYMRHVGSPTNRLQARRMSKMSMVNRAYFVRKHPDEFEKRAYWKTFLGMTLLSAMRMQWSAVGGLFDGVKIVVREGSRLNDSQHD